MQPYHRLRHPQLLGQSFSAKDLTAILAVKKVSHERTDRARVGGRSEREKQEGEIESCRVPLDDVVAQYATGATSCEG